eukprot:scaffold32770_cov37-Attheya_sp.AAC.1
MRTSRPIPRMRPAFEPQERDASNGPIDFQISVIASAKNCRLVQNAMRQRQEREKDGKRHNPPPPNEIQWHRPQPNDREITLFAPPTQP